MKAKSAHRYRICGTPVKTGCITCKIRRVKCGEEKPKCLRCTSTGRKCDGYANPDKPSPGSQSPVLRSFSLTPNPAEEPDEQDALSFFITSTAPGLSGYFSSNFWDQRVCQAATEPSVRHGAIAIGAVHRSFLERHENSGRECEEFAFHQHTKAISHLQQRMSVGTQRLDITLIACILFIVFDCLLGNYTSAIIHLQAGLKILENMKLQNAQGSTYGQLSSAHDWEREFSPLLLALGVQIAGYGYPMPHDDQAALWASLKRARLSTQLTTFTSFNEARHALDSLVASIMAERTSITKYTNQQELRGSTGLESKLHVAALEEWEAALDESRSQLLKENALDLKSQLAMSMLKIHVTFRCIVIDIPTSWDEKLDKLLRLCETLIETKSHYASAYPVFSVDFGVIAPLFFVASKASQKSIKQRACNMLLQAPGREGMWNNDDALRVADEAVGVETWQELHERLVRPELGRRPEARTWDYFASDSGSSIPIQRRET